MINRPSYLSDIEINKFILRFNILRDKINFDIPLNYIDKKLLSILEEYDFYIDDIDDEQTIINECFKNR